MSSRNRRPALSSFNNKSSVLCPETRHITSQYLALEQLEAHHKMVSKAKGAVDTSTPKSLQSYISSFDKKKKQLWRQTTPVLNLHDRFDVLSDCPLQHRSNFTQNDHDSVAENTDNHSISLNKSIQAGFPMPSYESKVADKITWYLEAVAQGEFHNSISKNHRPSVVRGQFCGSQTSLSSSMRSGKVVKGDLLDWHRKCFTPENRTFSPRILAKNSTQSKLLNMRCYNHPRKQRKSNSLNSCDTFESDDEEEHSSSNSSVYNNESEVFEEEDKSEENEEINSIPENLPTHHSDEPQEYFSEKVPKSSIKLKHKNYTSTKSSVSNQKLYSNFFQTISHLNSSHSEKSSEEEKCLKFLCDVTEDILRSGIYTDRAIRRSFDFHIQFYPTDSNEGHLKKLLDQIIDGLKVCSDDSEQPFTLPNFESTTENLNCSPSGIESMLKGMSMGPVENEISEDFEQISINTENIDKSCEKDS